MEALTAVTGEVWEIREGYRSARRYSSLRRGGGWRRPGERPVPRCRSRAAQAAGLAAAVGPVRGGLAAPDELWEILRELCREEGLEIPVPEPGEPYFLQWPEANRATRLRALEWVRAGFPELPLLPPPVQVRVFLDGEWLRDADAALHGDLPFLTLRPVADALDWRVMRRCAGWLLLAREPEGETGPLRKVRLLRLRRKGQELVPMAELKRLGVQSEWRSGGKEVWLETEPSPWLQALPEALLLPSCGSICSGDGTLV
jgi:hypothetical protein